MLGLKNLKKVLDKMESAVYDVFKRTGYLTDYITGYARGVMIFISSMGKL